MAQQSLTASDNRRIHLVAPAPPPRVTWIEPQSFSAVQERSRLTNLDAPIRLGANTKNEPDDDLTMPHIDYNIGGTFPEEEDEGEGFV